MIRRIALCACLFAPNVYAQSLHIVDAYPMKARYNPGEAVKLIVQTAGAATSETINATVTDIGVPVGTCASVSAATSTGVAVLTCTVPKDDYRGYMVEIALKAGDNVIDHRNTAVDVSSDWKKFPRYGYLAHYNAKEGAEPAEWVSELNKFHINGLQFYDFQFRHDQPLAGTPAAPAAAWPEISMREVDRSVVLDFIEQAHQRNMMAMAYNASYSGYQDVFSRAANPFPLSFGVWSDGTSPRTPETVKSISMPVGWATSKLLYMNQNDPGWQHYIFGQMNALFQVYPFDGWQVDTFGERTAYSQNGNLVDFVEGMPAFINHAHAALSKRIVMNAVATRGQEGNARTSADFVYSELWELNETYAQIRKAVQEVKKANPEKSVVFAAYVNRDAKGLSNTFGKKEFNNNAVLLTDAAIFASGASHIELGDGDRMLSSEYFPNDKLLTISPELRASLRSYYDVQTGYERYLADSTDAKLANLTVNHINTSDVASGGKLWSITRQTSDAVIIHLINLTSATDGKWRDSTISMSSPQEIVNASVHFSVEGKVSAIGVVSPDIAGGSFQALKYECTLGSNGQTDVHMVLPSLKYWDFIVVKR